MESAPNSAITAARTSATPWFGIGLGFFGVLDPVSSTFFVPASIFIELQSITGELLGLLRRKGAAAIESKQASTRKYLVYFICLEARGFQKFSLEAEATSNCPRLPYL